MALVGIPSHIHMPAPNTFHLAAFVLAGLQAFNRMVDRKMARSPLEGLIIYPEGEQPLQVTTVGKLLSHVVKAGCSSGGLEREFIVSSQAIAVIATSEFLTWIKNV